MIIGIDGNEANVKNRVGVGRYAFELLIWLNRLRVTSLCRGFGRQASCEFRVYLKEKPLADLPRETDWWKYKIVGPKKLWTQIGLPLALWKEKLAGKSPAVFFTPSHYAPRFCPCPTVISIMDLAFLYFPQMFKKQDLYQLKNWTGYSVKKAARILTISKASKNDIIKYYRVPKEKAIVTYPGFSMASNIKRKCGITGDYILSVGTLQPRKNYVRLIQALNILISQYPNISLVIVGKKGWLWEEILAAPKKFGVENKVKFLDFVTDEDLAGLYQGARCFVLVSLYEGFGIPILEAMNYSCPVVASNVSSLPEVAGEAGILVNPNNVDDIARGIKEALENRKGLIVKGFKQAKKFSWEKCAKETLAVLKEVGSK